MYEFWESNTILHQELGPPGSWGWAKQVSRVRRLIRRFQQHWTPEGACGPEVDHCRPEVGYEKWKSDKETRETLRRFG